MAYISHPKIILHIDDDPDDRLLVNQALNTINPYIVLHQAPNGKMALDFLARAKRIGELPSLIIMDMNMPVMSGNDIYREIKKDTGLSNIPIAIFTTSRDIRDVDYWKKENVIMITKPGNFKELIEKLKNILAYCSI